MSEPRRIVLLGPRGQIGWELHRTLAPLGEVIALDRTALDLSDLAAARDAVRAARPHAIVNAAAYTDVDGAESERAAAFALNADAPAMLARTAADTGALLIHFSTDYVFDGTGRRPYTEGDRTAPLSVYGASKREGERAVLESGADAVIFRTSWVYGTRGRNFLRTILALARQRDELRVVDDQIGAPTWSRAVAEAVALILGGLVAGDGFLLPPGAGGILHLTAAGQTSWYGFAGAILEHDPEPTLRRANIVTPIATADFPRPAARPAYSVLDNTRVMDTFGVRLPDWRTLLALALAQNDGGADTPARG